MLADFYLFSFWWKNGENVFFASVITMRGQGIVRVVVVVLVVVDYIIAVAIFS